MKRQVLLLAVYGAMGFLGTGCGAGVDDPSTQPGEEVSAREDSLVEQQNSLPPFEYTCEGNALAYTYCPSPLPIEQVWLRRKLSQEACDQGRTWGYDANGVWVKEGCKGVFVVTPASPPPPPPPPPQPVTTQVTCSSSRFRFASCNTGLRISGVQLVQKHSRSGCTQGHSWGHDGYSLWVNHGCRATFLVHGYPQ